MRTASVLALATGLSIVAFIPAAQVQELSNPVPGAIAVNAQLEHEKRSEPAPASLRSQRKAIREADFECRLQVVNQHARGSDGRKRAMAACDSRRDKKLRALEEQR